MPQMQKKKSRFEQAREEVDPSLLATWEAQQHLLASRLDLVTQPLPPKLLGGVDISQSKTHPGIGCSCLIIVEYPSMKQVYSDQIIVKLDLPYVPGLLAFREMPSILQLFRRLELSKPELKPDVVLLDGNGILHVNGFGLACHLGVTLNLSTIGCGKTLFYVDGLTKQKVQAIGKSLKPKEHRLLVGTSGKVWGAALRPTQDCSNPIFVSVGNKIGIQMAVQIVQNACIYRVAEPIRLADKRSRYIIERLNKDQIEKALSLQMEMMK